MTQTEILAAHLWLTDEEITLLASKIWADHQISVHPDTLRIGADAATEQARLFYEAEIAEIKKASYCYKIGVLWGKDVVRTEAIEAAAGLVMLADRTLHTLWSNKPVDEAVQKALEHWQKWVNG